MSRLRSPGVPASRPPIAAENASASSRLTSNSLQSRPLSEQSLRAPHRSSPHQAEPVHIGNVELEQRALGVERLSRYSAPYRAKLGRNFPPVQVPSQIPPFRKPGDRLAGQVRADRAADLHSLSEARRAFEPLAEASYIYSPHRPGVAHHFAKPSTEAPLFGLHLTEPGSDLWRERFAFRYVLLGDARLAAEYEALKHELANEYPEDIEAYTACKRAFVARVLATVGLEPGRR
jgi:hypothetical protein